MKTREEIYKELFSQKGRPLFEAAILDVLLDIREILMIELMDKYPAASCDLLSEKNK